MATPVKARQQLKSVIDADQDGGYWEIVEFDAPQGGASLWFAQYDVGPNDQPLSRIYLVLPGCAGAHRYPVTTLTRLAQWSADGRYVAFRAENPESFLVVCDAKQSRHAQIPLPSAFCYDLAFAGNSQLVASRQSDARDLSHLLQRKDVRLDSLAWQPFGRADHLSPTRGGILQSGRKPAQVAGVSDGGGLGFGNLYSALTFGSPIAGIGLSIACVELGAPALSIYPLLGGMAMFFVLLVVIPVFLGTRAAGTWTHGARLEDGGIRLGPDRFYRWEDVHSISRGYIPMRFGRMPTLVMEVQPIATRPGWVGRLENFLMREVGLRRRDGPGDRVDLKGKSFGMTDDELFILISEQLADAKRRVR